MARSRIWGGAALIGETMIYYAVKEIEFVFLKKWKAISGSSNAKKVVYCNRLLQNGFCKTPYTYNYISIK